MGMLLLMSPFRYYRQLIDQVDAWARKASERYGHHVVCRKGCDICCQRRFSVFSVEAHWIARAYRKLPARTQHLVREPKAHCSFLVDHACSIYADRPIICRTYGLPSATSADDGRSGVSWCELNFTELLPDFEFAPDGVLDVDTLNVKLAAVNRLFMEEAGSVDVRVEMDEVPDIDPDVLEGPPQTGE